MPNVCRNCFKFAILITLITTSALTIYINHTGSSFDPIKEIISLKNQNRRDDALDMAKFYGNYQNGEKEKITALQNDLEYTTTEKIKSFAWDGFIIGRVHDSYSGVGAISSDLCLYGDVRDLGIQGWKRLAKSDEADSFVAVLSAAGIGLSTTAFIDGGIIRRETNFCKQP